VRTAYNGPWPEGTAEARALAGAIAIDPVEVPPWAQARVWARIEARRQRAHRIRKVLAFAAAPAVGLVVALVASLHGVVSGGMAGTRWADGSQRAVDVHGDARVVLAEGSRVSLVEDDSRGVVFDVARGSLLARVKHRPAGSPFRVHTPKADVKVVGTVLWVDVAPDGTPTVSVARGVVEVTPTGGETVSVHGGERWPAGSARAPTPADVSLLGTDALEGGRFAPPVALGAASTQTGCEGLVGRAALACLDRLAASDDPLRAESALYEIGWRQLREMGDARAALAAWQKQRARFPGGVLRLEADVSIIEALVRLRDDAHARHEIDAYLGAHPDGMAAPEVHYLRGSLERAGGDCARALAEFDFALRTPAEPWAAEARAERAACLQKTR
jgi:hypothetical protein